MIDPGIGEPCADVDVLHRDRCTRDSEVSSMECFGGLPVTLWGCQGNPPKTCLECNFHAKNALIQTCTDLCPNQPGWIQTISFGPFVHRPFFHALFGCEERGDEETRRLTGPPIQVAAKATVLGSPSECLHTRGAFGFWASHVWVGWLVTLRVWGKSCPQKRINQSWSLVMRLNQHLSHNPGFCSHA